MGMVGLVIIGVIVVFAVFIYFTAKWAANYVQRIMTRRLDAVDQIVNEKRVPDAWIARYIKRIAVLKDKPDSEKAITRFKSLAVKNCKVNLDELIRFTEATRYADADDTKRQLLASLREQRERWDDIAFWDAVFERNAEDLNA